MSAAVSGKVAKRKGHRGWMLVSSSVDAVVHIYKQQWVAAKLVDFPERLIWPVEGDLAGASVLVDAVMARDAVAIRQLERQHPEGGDFGLGDWWRQLRDTFVAKAQTVRQTLKSMPLAGGAVLDVDCETDSLSGRRTLAAVIRRGQAMLARRVISTESLPLPASSSTAVLERDDAHD